MKKTTIYLPIQLKNDLKVLARQSHKSEAEIVRAAVFRYVEAEIAPRPEPQSFGMVADGTFDASRDEEYLEEHWKPDW